MGKALLSAFLIAGSWCTFSLSQSQSDGYVRENYTKYEYLVPVRDGVKLFTSVYVPKDHSKAYPIMVTRTPYSVAPYGADNFRTSLGPSEPFMRDGFIFVYQDVRGRYMSEGEWVEVRPQVDHRSGNSDIDESTDTYDSIDWLVRNVPGNNGRVGLWGISYGGFYTAAGIIGAHPSLKAASPQAPIGDYFMGDDSFHNGAFMLAANFGFYTFFSERKGGPSPPGDAPAMEVKAVDGYDFFLRLGPLSNSNTRYFKNTNPYWNLNLDHTTYDDFWKKRAIVRHLTGIKPAILTVGGWFDAEDLAGPLSVYRTIEASSPGITNALVMGPWTHGSWSRGDGDRIGNLNFASKTGVYFREKIEFPFFARFLKDKDAGTPEPEARVFLTGLNEWREFRNWPPADAAVRSFYFRENGLLGAEPASSDAEAYDEYLSDPNRPVPYLGYVAMGMTRDYMTEDQRFAATRPDVLVYQTDPLQEDFTVVGPVKVRLHVSTTGTDSDWVVKLIDVYPDDYPTPRPEKDPSPQNAVRMGGYQQLVRGEPFRGKFRGSFEKPEPFVPGKPERIEYAMPDVGHCFRRGHRVMVQVQSSWFPLVDRNPQTFCDIPNAKESDFRRATERVYRSRLRPSGISFAVLPH